MSDLKFALFALGFTLVGGGVSLASLPFPDSWKTAGKVGSVAGLVIGVVAAFIPG